MRRLLRVIAVLAAAAAAPALFAPIMEYVRSGSPDGAFAAVAHTQPFYSMIPMMPGQAATSPAV